MPTPEETRETKGLALIRENKLIGSSIGSTIDTVIENLNGGVAKGRVREDDDSYYLVNSIGLLKSVKLLAELMGVAEVEFELQPGTPSLKEGCAIGREWSVKVDYDAAAVPK